MCDTGKVKNPLTNRCINIGSAVFKKLLADPNVVFSDEDLAKIKAVGLMPLSEKTPPPPKPKSDEIVEIKKVSAKTSNKMMKYVNRSLIPGDPYISKKHSDYCKTPTDLSVIDEPLVITKINYKIPYSTCPLQKSTYVDYLDSKKIPYTTGFNKSIHIEYNNYNKAVAMQLFKDHDIDIDIAWFKKMDNYIRNLSTYDAFTVLGYSYHSFDFINRYMMGNMTPAKMKGLMNEYTYSTYYFPLYMQMHTLIDKLVIKPDIDIDIDITHDSQKKKISKWIEWCKGKKPGECYKLVLKIMKSFPYTFIVQAFDLFKKDLSRIIKSSPPIEKELVIYRGVKNDYFIRDAKKKYYTNKTFVSCSLDPNHAYVYLRGNKCCFKRIVMLPGTHALFISGISCYPNEMEMVVDVDSIMYISKVKTYKKYDEYGNYSKEDMCFKNNTYDVQIAEIIVSP
jgi:hypothetical protein